MKKIELNKGRVRQKQKTRNHILDSAKILMKKRSKLSLEDIAEKAKVSRATIYRYFPNVELLFAEASLDINYKSPEEISDTIKGKTLNEKIKYIQNYYNGHAQKHELEFRRYLIAALTASVQSNMKIRGARRVQALRKSLNTTQNKLDKDLMNDLVNISAILMGIDAYVTAKDVCGLSSKEALNTLEWGLDMILKGINMNNK